MVIPVHDGARFVAEAVRSVERQTHGPTEIIVVDDGSTDATARIVRRMKGVRYAYQHRAGQGSALNRGVAMARGRYLSFLSADDIWCPEKLALQHVALGANPSGKLVFGHMRAFADGPGDRRRLERQPASALPVAAIAAGTLLTTRKAFASVGGFDERFALGEFIDWYGRARILGLETVMLSQVISLRRIHASNHSTRMLRETSYIPVLKAHLDRVRASRGAS